MADELAMIGDQAVETAATLQQRVAAVHAAYKGVMQEGVHYGTIPHTNKPTLLKAGAEMLCTQFRLVPSYDIRCERLDGGHREYSVTCTLTKLDTGQVWAQGVGLCSTMESKYRYRWDRRTRTRTENPDIADTYNTVLKMAKKRAMVDATLTATGCSDMFTQDVEDFQTPTVYEVPKPDRLDALREQTRRLKRAGGDVASVMEEFIPEFGRPEELADDVLETAVGWMSDKADEAEAAKAQQAADVAPEDIEF